MFHLRSLEIVRPNTFTEGTTSMFLWLITMGSNRLLDLEKLTQSSLHLVSLSWNPSTWVFVTSSSTYFCIELGSFFFTDSARVVLSTYFQSPTLSTFKSLIIMTNNQGPSFVPCGTPAGTAPHSANNSHCLISLSAFDTSENPRSSTQLSLECYN